MSVPYKAFYRLGFHPWEDLAEHPPFANKLSELLEQEDDLEVVGEGAPDHYRVRG